MFEFSYQGYASFEYEQLQDRLCEMERLLEQIDQRLIRSEEIESTRRYHLTTAADYLGVSPRTLLRRAKVGQLVVLRDGRKPFVSGAELLRYVRETGRKKR